jgi:hypothetical protein
MLTVTVVVLNWTRRFGVLKKYSYPNLSNLAGHPVPHLTGPRDPHSHPPEIPASNNLFLGGSQNRQKRRVQLST